jgi:hypothetical protein
VPYCTTECTPLIPQTTAGCLQITADYLPAASGVPCPARTMISVAAYSRLTASICTSSADSLLAAPCLAACRHRAPVYDQCCQPRQQQAVQAAERNSSSQPTVGLPSIPLPCRWGSRRSSVISGLHVAYFVGTFQLQCFWLLLDDSSHSIAIRSICVQSRPRV